MPARLDSGRALAVARVRAGCLLLFLSLSCCGFVSFTHAESHSVLCTDGTGTFEAVSFAKVQVRVGATRKGPLAVRSCEATLSWNDEKLVVATDIPALDLDAFGIDLGLGPAVAAFEL